MSRGKRTPDGKRTRWLLAQLPDGFSIENRGRSHLLVLRPDGEPLRDVRGMPVLVSGTTYGGQQAARRDLARIQKALRSQP